MAIASPQVERERLGIGSGINKTVQRPIHTYHTRMMADLRKKDGFDWLERCILNARQMKTNLAEIRSYPAKNILTHCKNHI